MMVCSSLSTDVFCRHVMLAAPMSPVVENFTPSLLTLIVTALRAPVQNGKHKSGGLTLETWTLGTRWWGRAGAPVAQ
jgi:hypothetical protein